MRLTVTLLALCCCACPAEPPAPPPAPAPAPPAPAPVAAEHPERPPGEPAHVVELLPPVPPDGFDARTWHAPAWPMAELRVAAGDWIEVVYPQPEGDGFVLTGISKQGARNVLFTRWSEDRDGRRLLHCGVQFQSAGEVFLAPVGAWEGASVPERAVLELPPPLHVSVE